MADRKRTISQIQHNRFYCSTVLLCGGGEKFEHINPKNQTNIDTDQQCVWYESIAISEANGYSGIYIIIVPNTGYVVEFFGTQLLIWHSFNAICLFVFFCLYFLLFVSVCSPNIQCHTLFGGYTSMG